ncbi:TonB-dependent receptor domain-containing protein [Calditrichota bacterium]
MKIRSLIVFYLLIFSALTHAGVTGKLIGTVFNKATNEPLAGANIEIIDSYTGAAADVDGHFVILNMSPGIITVRVSFIGYESTVFENIRINVDQTTQLPVYLNPSNLTLGREIIIVAQRPLIQKDLTSTISVVRRDELESLPIAKFTDVLALQAGVVGEGENFSVRGGRSNEVAYLIDGMYVSDPLLGGLATQVGNDAIEEMSLLSGTFNAEYGNALSGVVNIVTRDGGDKLEGRIEARTSNFGIKRYTDLEEMRINGNISGPLLTEKLRFFLSAEHDRRGNYLPWGYNRTWTFFSKLSLYFMPTLKLTVSNRGSKGERQNYSHSYKYIPDQYLRRRTDSWQSVVALTHTIQNNLFYDLRVSYFNQGYYSGVDKDTSEYITSSQRTYYEQYGTGIEFYSKADPLQLTSSRTATADAKFDMVWQPDNLNEVKLGLQYQSHWLNLFSIYDPKRDNPYVDDYKTKPFEAVAYIQDKIEFPFLIINLGLRYDYADANVLFRKTPLDPNSQIKVKPRSQISPRLGIAHPISTNTKLHFSYGHFFQRPEYQYLFENKQYDIGVREPIFGTPNLDAERTISYEVGITHQFNDRIGMNLTAYYKDVTGLIGTRYFEFRDAYTNQYTAYTLYINEDYANIKGFEINLDMRPDGHFSGGLSYTFSVAKGSASSETEQYPGTQESTKLYYLNHDRTHLFNASGTYRIRENEGPEILGSKVFENLDINMVFRASSGRPYTPSGRDIGFVDRNSLRQPGTYSLDMEIGKKFEFSNGTSLRVFAEILNVTDHRNVLYVYSDTGDPDFTYVGGYSPDYQRDPSNYGPPRTIRLGMGFSFK